MTSGVELAIPLPAIGAPAACVGVCALVMEPQANGVLNQVLAPVPPGTCAFGDDAGPNFANLAGDQHFTACLSIDLVRDTSWGTLKTHYR